jgi:hypothetical protein
VSAQVPAPRRRLTYRAVWQVDDRQDPTAAEAVAKRLGPPAVSAAIDTAMARLLADWPVVFRPEVGAVSVVAVVADAAPLDPSGPFADPSGQDLLASFLAGLLAWADENYLDPGLEARAKGLLAGLGARP